MCRIPVWLHVKHSLLFAYCFSWSVIKFNGKRKRKKTLGLFSQNWKDLVLSLEGSKKPFRRWFIRATENLKARFKSIITWTGMKQKNNNKERKKVMKARKVSYNRTYWLQDCSEYKHSGLDGSLIYVILQSNLHCERLSLCSGHSVGFDRQLVHSLKIF